MEAGEPERTGYVYCSGGPPGTQYSFATSPPSHGVLSDTRTDQFGGALYYTYTSAAAYRGPDGFTVNASRGGETASVDVSFNVVAPFNAEPNCDLRGPRFDGYKNGQVRGRFPAGKPVVGRLVCSDEEHAALSYAFVQPPAFGSVSGVHTERGPKSQYGRGELIGSFTLTPEAGYSGPDDFTLRVFDGATCTNVQLNYLVLPAKKHPNPPVGMSPGCGAPDPRPLLLFGRSAAAAVRVSKKGSFVLPKHLIACAGAGPACRVKISVAATARANFARTLRIGKSSFKLAADKRRKVKGKLSRKGRAWLKLARSWRAKVKITSRRGKASPVKKTIRLTLKAPK